MPRLLLFFLALTIGSIVGWFLLAGSCSVVSLSFKNACGHNAYIWLPVFIPMGIFVTWFSLHCFQRVARTKSKFRSDKGG